MQRLGLSRHNFRRLPAISDHRASIPALSSPRVHCNTLLANALARRASLTVFGRLLATQASWEAALGVSGTTSRDASSSRRCIKLIIESIRIAATPAKRGELVRALGAWAGPTAVESGCLSCRIFQETTDPQAFCYQAQWKTQDDLLRHIRTEHYKRLLALMCRLGNSPEKSDHPKAESSKGHSCDGWGAAATLEYRGLRSGFLEGQLQSELSRAWAANGVECALSGSEPADAAHGDVRGEAGQYLAKAW